MHILNYLDDWLILGQFLDTLISDIDSLLIHLESLGLGVNMQKSIIAPSVHNISDLISRFRVIRGDDALQSRGLDTLTEARAPSTRCLYALKWGVFVKWCGQAHIDPVTCTVSDVLSFLQYRLDSGSLTSTLEVYVAAITAFRSPQTVIMP